MKFRAIIFDIDGTLVDSLGAYQVAFNNGIGKFGLAPVGGKALADKLSEGMTLEEIITSFYPDQSDPSFLITCREEVLKAFREITDGGMPLLPGARELLELLTSLGLDLGVATGRTTPSDRVKIWLEELGIGSFFKAIVTSADVPERKPAPDCVLECARRLGVPVGECLVVGDSTVDIGAAKAAGASVVAVLTGVSGRQRLSSLEPLAILQDLTELAAFLEIEGTSLTTTTEMPTTDGIPLTTDGPES